ncbi:MAG: hypothetical protein HY240_02560, partial [Actinobacteria bacterium]|nr:hypothetical protein [Actinomycetota bacterium]
MDEHVSISLPARSRRTGATSRWIRSRPGALRVSLAAAAVLCVLVAQTPPASAASQMMSYVQMIGLPRHTTPEGVAVDASGHVFVTDTVTPADSSGDEIAEYTANGVFLDVLAGPGNGNGQVFDPTSIAISPTTGDIFTVEKGGSSTARVQRFDSLGNYVTKWGAYGTGNGMFKAPEGIAVDPSGNVWVADTGNKRIQEFTPGGIWQSTIDLSVSPIVTPLEVAFDASGVLYVVGSNKVYRFDASGALLNSWSSSGATGVEIDGSGDAWVTSSSGGTITVYDATGAVVAGPYAGSGSGSGQLSGPQGVAIAPAGAPNAGKVYVADTGNGRIERFSSAGAYQTDWGHYPAPGVMDSPKGIAVDASDNVYVTNQAQGIIQKFDKNGALLAESTYGAGSGNGQLSASDVAAALAIDPSTGNLYVADTNNYRIQEFTPSLTYLTQWGSFGSSDGQFNKPQGIAVDGSGDIYVADTSNNRIQEFSAPGVWVRTWGSSAPSAGSATGAFRSPKGLAIDGSGNVWVADSGNNRIQEFGPTGVFIQAWGTGGSGNGLLAGPSDLDFEAGGAVLVDDMNNARVQRFTTSGGYLDQLGSLGLDLYQFDTPAGIAIDGTGRLLVADTNNNRVQVFSDLSGPTTTITSGPAAISASGSATFQFQANDVGVSFQCKMDGGSYAACTSGVSYSGLPDGGHTFRVFATDSLNNPGNATTYSWTIDTTAPVVTITMNPPLIDNSTSPSFSFSADEAVTGFTCQLDSGASASCTSPDKLSSVPDGSHTFQVWAYDLAGNQSAIASYTWTVDTTAPTVTIDSGPSGTVLVDSASFSFSSSTDPSATFQCQLDSGGFSSCTSPTSYTALPSGQHTFSVEAVDALGNVSIPVSRSWTVDTATHRPDGQIGTGT